MWSIVDHPARQPASKLLRRPLYYRKYTSLLLIIFSKSLLRQLVSAMGRELAGEEGSFPSFWEAPAIASLQDREMCPERHILLSGGGVFQVCLRVSVVS